MLSGGGGCCCFAAALADTCVCCAVSGLFREDGGRGVGAASKFLVEHIESHAVVADERILVDKSAAVVFFLYLFAYEPVETIAGCIVFFSFGQCVKVVDEGCDFLFVFRVDLNASSGDAQLVGTASMAFSSTRPPRWLT